MMMWSDANVARYRRGPHAKAGPVYAYIYTGDWFTSVQGDDTTGEGGTAESRVQIAGEVRTRNKTGQARPSWIGLKTAG